MAEDCERLNTMLSVQAKRALERLTFYRGAHQWEVLDDILRAAEAAALDEITQSRVITTEDYFEKRLRRNGKV